jgi:hypothetical protein
LNDSLLAFFRLAVSTDALCKDGPKLSVLLRSRQKFADPDDLLKPFTFADLKDELLGVTKLIGGKALIPIYQECNVAVPSSERRSGNLVNRPPGKAKWCRVVQRIRRKT